MRDHPTWSRPNNQYCSLCNSAGRAPGRLCVQRTAAIREPCCQAAPALARVTPDVVAWMPRQYRCLCGGSSGLRTHWPPRLGAWVQVMVTECVGAGSTGVSALRRDRRQVACQQSEDLAGVRAHLVDKEGHRRGAPQCGVRSTVIVVAESRGEKCSTPIDLRFPELGYVSLNELESVHGTIGPRIERDRHWTPKALREGRARPVSGNEFDTVGAGDVRVFAQDGRLRPDMLQVWSRLHPADCCSASLSYGRYW